MLPPTERGIDKPNISGEVSNRQNVSDQNPYGAIDLGDMKVDLNQTPSHGGIDYGNTPAYDMGDGYGNYGAYQTPQYEFNNTNNSDGNNNNNYYNNPIPSNINPSPNNNNNNNSQENEGKETVFNMNN